MTPTPTPTPTPEPTVTPTPTPEPAVTPPNLVTDQGLDDVGLPWSAMALFGFAVIGLGIVLKVRRRRL